VLWRFLCCSLFFSLYIVVVYYLVGVIVVSWARKDTLGDWGLTCVCVGSAALGELHGIHSTRRFFYEMARGLVDGKGREVDACGCTYLPACEYIHSLVRMDELLLRCYVVLAV
jgi:hypothetical protein